MQERTRTSRPRGWRTGWRPLAVLAVLAGGLLALACAGSAQAFDVEWEAGTCKESTCTDAGSPSAFYTQAAGHPNFGITDFSFPTEQKGVDDEKPLTKVKDVRVDLPAGLAVNPEAAPTCAEAQLQKFECPEDSRVGEDQAKGTAELFKLLGVSATLTEHFPVYNMVRKPGEPARFGVEVNSSNLKLLALKGDHLQGEIYLEGGISWHKEAESAENSGVESGDYHEYFRIDNIPEQPEIIESRLIFDGVVDGHAFLTLPSTCTSKPVTSLHVDSYGEPGNFVAAKNTTPVAATGCEALAFHPSLSLAAESTQSDQPDGVSADLHVPQSTDEPSQPNSPDVQSAEVTLPEGMTLNPAAAQGLVGCSGEEFERETCPQASEVGSFALNAPGIPNGSLTGGVYVASPAAGKGPESGEEFRVFLIGEATQYGVGLHLEGRISANVGTGRLTAVFPNAPQVPFEDLTLHFRGGARAPLANPLACGSVEATAAITPYGGEAAKAAEPHPGFVVDANGAGGGCSSPLAFSLTQSLTPQAPGQAGAYDPATFSLSRPEGQQYLSQITTTLPAGLLGSISSVPLCEEPQAGAGECSPSSGVGTVSVQAGSGSEPYTFTGNAYLTGPYDGAPYGLSVVVPAEAGPYNLGTVRVRAGISVGLYSGRVSVTSTLPSVVEGVPLRLRALNVAVNRHDFLFNPTSCAALATESVLASTSGASQSLASPFQVGNCGALAFKPSLVALSGGRPTKAGGASLEVKITQGANEANIREVQLQLPKQLVSRLTTIQKACPAASFEAGPPPGSCSHKAVVGSVTVSTPVLPGKLTGPAYLVSHGGEAFPDLDLILEGDGVEVVLVGHTQIKSGITTTTFESLPDVPISNVTLSLPLGSNSALSANGALCRATLLAPTTIISQSAVKLAAATKIGVKGCALQLISHKRRGKHMILEIWAPEAGWVSVRARGVHGVGARVRKARELKLSVPLSTRKRELRVGFTPSAGHNTSAVSLAAR
jgi:hypothetical protein